MLYINHTCLYTSKIKYSEPNVDKGLKGLYLLEANSQNHLHIKQKGTIYKMQEGTIYRGLEVVQLSLRGISIIVVVAHMTLGR